MTPERRAAAVELLEEAGAEQLTMGAMLRRHPWIADVGVDVLLDGLARRLAPAPLRVAPLRRPPTAGAQWTSFAGEGRALHEKGNPEHRVRVEHDRHSLLVHLSGESGGGWTTLAVDRRTRRWAVGQDGRQRDAAQAAFEALYAPPDDED